MNQLEQKSITSMEVAEMVEKDHSKLLRDIRTYISQLGQAKIGQSDFFTDSSYVNNQNREMPCYLVTKKGCEFISHKLTGTKGTEFTAKYINRFHDMEEIIQKPMSAMELLELQIKAIKEVGTRVENINADLQDFKTDMPLLAIECDRITTAVRIKGVRCLGGKDSNAYADKSLRGKVYSDIYSELKRQFGVTSYKAIKRSQCDKAVSIIDGYVAPLVLDGEINNSNAQFKLREVG